MTVRPSLRAIYSSVRSELLVHLPLTVRHATASKSLSIRPRAVVTIVFMALGCASSPYSTEDGMPDHRDASSPRTALYTLLHKHIPEISLIMRYHSPALVAIQWNLIQGNHHFSSETNGWLPSAEPCSCPYSMVCSSPSSGACRFH